MEKNNNQPLFDQDREDIISLTDQSEVEEKILEEEIIKKTVPSNFFIRNFCRQFGEGSLRAAIVSLTKMAWGIGVFTLPFYVSQVGLLGGFILLLVSAGISYYTQILVFKNSLYYQQNNFEDLVQISLPLIICKLAKLTMFIDYCSGPLLYSISSWKICENFLLQFDILKKEDLIDDETLEFDESVPRVIISRVIFFGALLLLNSPLLIKKRIDSLRFLSLATILSILFIIIIITIQIPLYYNHYNQNHELQITYYFKKPSFDFILTFFAMMSSYASQVFSLDIKNELHNPNLRRLTKVTRYTTFYHIFTFSIIGLCAYVGFGDKYTPELIFLRKSLNSQSIFEYFLKFGQFAFLIATLLSLSIYNVSLKKFLIRLISGQKKKIGRFKYIMYSYIPFILLISIGVLYPKIIKVFNIFGLSVWSFNSTILPLMIEINRLKQQNQSKFLIFFNSLLCILVITSMIIGFLKNIELIQLIFIIIKMSGSQIEIQLNNQMQIEPSDNERFYPSRVRDEVKEILKNSLEDFVLDEITVQEKTEELTNQIRETLKETLYIPRYKLIVQVVMGKLNGQGLKVTSKCLWDTNSDNYASYTHKTDDYYCTVMVFGLYNE